MNDEKGNYKDMNVNILTGFPLLSGINPRKHLYLLGEKNLC